METLESLGSHIAAYPLCQTDAAKAPCSFAFRNRQSVREISTPAAIFPLTGHGRFTFRAQCLHASIIQILHSRLQDGEVVTRRDYRFRAPNILLLQERFEHSIWGPFGLQFVADQGRVAVVRGDLGFGHLTHSFAGGLTLRAGGFPMVSMMFAWGGPEGHHNIFNMNTSLI